jgi:hypothetical protein
MFHRRYPELKISPSTLQRVYKIHRIKFKLIKRIKRTINFRSEPYKGQIMELKQKIDLLV